MLALATIVLHMARAQLDPPKTGISEGQVLKWKPILEKSGMAINWETART